MPRRGLDEIVARYCVADLLSFRQELRRVRERIKGGGGVVVIRSDLEART